MKLAAPLPEKLWPLARLQGIVREPVGWLTIDEHFYGEEEQGGRGCVLVKQSDVTQAIRTTSWVGRDLGDFNIWSSFGSPPETGFDLGLATRDNDADVQFFAQVRRPSGGHVPIADVSLPFLWFWDAYRVDDGWRYVNRAGRERELLRWQMADDRWKVEVRALELRQFLFRTDTAAILQCDYILKRDEPDFRRVDLEHTSEWAHFAFWATHDRSVGSKPAMSGIMGQYVVTGADTESAPRFVERERPATYPEFIYATDTSTGQPLRHIADPDQLGTYFDEDGTRLHYLTPVYFKREVLQPYAAEPARYSVSTTRLSCLDLWGVSISINTAGLVEVYLGDLGRDLPEEEWGHWQTYNVPPDGEMEEGRFRRDFLSQWASSPDPIADLRQSRQKAVEVTSRVLGVPLWRRLDAQFANEFESLVGPLSDDPASLNAPILVVSKAIIDAIDPSALKSVVAPEAGEGSLSMLDRWVVSMGGTTDLVAPLRRVQALRSRGGVAHLRNSQSARAAEDLGILGLRPPEAFGVIARKLADSLEALSTLVGSERTGDH